MTHWEASCGTLLGDGRYCLDYSNRQLDSPPPGWNITSILNANKVKDLQEVICSSPSNLRGQKIFYIDAAPLCKNGTLHHGFEINTGTVFLIWIVVPILITLLTALYILINGNNRIARSLRLHLLAFAQRIHDRSAHNRPARAPARRDSGEPSLRGLVGRGEERVEDVRL